MKALSCVVVFQALLALSLAAVPSQPVVTSTACQLKDAIAMPGTGLAVMTAQQSCRIACRINELLTGNPRNSSRLAGFINMLRAARRNGIVCTGRVCWDSRTIKDVCCELGRLVLREQELERAGRLPEVAASLSKLAAARRSGASEKEVQQMARAAVANNELSPGALAERRSIQRRMDELTRELLQGGQVLAEQASSSASASHL